MMAGKESETKTQYFSDKVGLLEFHVLLTVSQRKKKTHEIKLQMSRKKKIL